MSNSSGPESIHPSILNTVNDVRAGIMNGKLTDQKSIAAATLYCQIRAVEYSKVFAAIGAGFLGVLIATAIAWFQLGRNEGLIVMFVLTAVWTVPSLRLHKSFAQRLTWPELNSLKSALYLTSDQALYLDCLQAIDESKTILGPEKVEWASRLNATIDAIMSGDNLAGETLMCAREALIQHRQIDSKLEEIKRELKNPL